ncbi:hypothetical protein SAMN02745181_3773 [Rubritalea squalenifaciens DSM 18772]|uniref:Uncharacterized protein n=2 Tax=Rubritalea squalenifaciens TaxID=407226 RepID=A0A1M6SAU1_9BACT|nr:hypothetical protein SAMN02745181_3773 [Rubritalea squalenifaciens DSM 18772]
MAPEYSPKEPKILPDFMKPTVLASFTIALLLCACDNKTSTASTPESPSQEPAQTESPAEQLDSGDTTATPKETAATPATSKKPAKSVSSLKGEWHPTGKQAESVFSYEFGNGDITILAREADGSPGDISLQTYTLGNVDGNRSITITDEADNKQTLLYTISQDTLTLYSQKGETLSVWKRN